MSIRNSLAGFATLSLAAIVFAQPKEPTPLEKKPAAPSVDQRLAEMEQRVAALIKELHGLRDELAKGSDKGTSQSDVKIYRLQHADAAKTVSILQGLLQGKDGQQMKIVADVRTNSILLAGRADLHELVEAIIERLDQGPAKKSERATEKRQSKTEESKVSEKTWAERVKQLETELGLLKERAAWAQRMVEKGYLSKDAWQMDLKSAVQAAELLKKAQEEYRRYSDKEKMPESGAKKEKKSDGVAPKK